VDPPPTPPSLPGVRSAVAVARADRDALDRWMGALPADRLEMGPGVPSFVVADFKDAMRRQCLKDTSRTSVASVQCCDAGHGGNESQLSPPRDQSQQPESRYHQGGVSNARVVVCTFDSQLHRPSPNIRQPKLPGTGDGHAVGYDQAAAECDAQGGRLCTPQELTYSMEVHGCARCSFSQWLRVWSRELC